MAPTAALLPAEPPPAEVPPAGPAASAPSPVPGATVRGATYITSGTCAALARRWTTHTVIAATMTASTAAANPIPAHDGPLVLAGGQ